MITLQSHQSWGASECAERIRKYNMCYLAWSMRVGKTLTSLAACELLGAKNVFFVTKKKAIPDIEKQYKELSPSFNIHIINYESAIKYDGENPDVVVCDESHGLSMYPKPSLRAKTMKLLIKKWNNPPIIYLSGTPTPESYSQIFWQLNISSHSPFAKYTNFYKWANDYVTVKKKYVAYGSPINDYSDANQTKIKEQIDHLFINYSQVQAGIKETVEEEILYVKMRPITYRLCDMLIKDLVVEGKEKIILADTSVKLQNKLHQLYSGTVIFEDGTSSVIDNSKAEFIKERFKGKKIAIFYKFKAELECLKESFPNHTDNDLDFNNSTDLTYLGQIQSSREGTNLSSADCLVFYSIDFSSISYFQARDRMTNRWRVKENKVFWIFSEGGIEKKIYKAVMNKKDYTLSYFKKDYGIRI